MGDPICWGIWALITVFIGLIYCVRWWQNRGDTEPGPLVFDARDPAQEHEYRCIKEQRRWGRERGPEIILINQKDGGE